ncbi:Ubox domain containing protein [Acanthamoeba castellanii str. Neff]|uniref:Ubox domain containing protein n=1 Tax=Acanthamoeba castellanii (strain ATCC 30010 / Neff) TaxID=1257118 RepID=L8HFW8_ACACF|nr:Ubox domain containing protein [Acanthamoeba castellanii str. Neff]ELR24434.1 Ubox domain containing protein [Acanthamoeba castellanii str. Neff]
MEWNFATRELGAEIDCSAVAMDGHDVATLLLPHSATPGAQARGRGAAASSFICATFVRTPVHLTLTFPHEVNVACVVLRPKVSSQVVQVVSVEVAPFAAPGTEDEWKYLGSYGDLHTKLTPPDHDSASAVLFYNPGFRGRALDWQDLPPSRSPGLPDRSRIRIDRSAYALAKVKKLKITIKKMEHSGYVGLAGLEVWGQPAASCDKATLTRVHTRLSALKPEPQPPRIALDRPPQPEWLEKLRRIPADALPAHFLDPITCEAMQDPVLLPSGNAVDRTTIERHLRNHLTDPFTGLPLKREDLVEHSSLRYEIYRFAYTYQLPPGNPAAPRAATFNQYRHGVPAVVDPAASALGAALEQRLNATTTTTRHKRRRMISDDDEDERVDRKQPRADDNKQSTARRTASPSSATTPTSSPWAPMTRYTVTRDRQGNEVITLGSDDDEDDDQEGQKQQVTITIDDEVDGGDEDEPKKRRPREERGEEEEIVEEGRVVTTACLQQEGERSVCVVCGTQPPELAVALPCDHRCCRSCALRAIRQQQQQAQKQAACPTCRRPFAFIDIRRVHAPEQ